MLVLLASLGCGPPLVLEDDDALPTGSASSGGEAGHDGASHTSGHESASGSSSSGDETTLTPEDSGSSTGEPATDGESSTGPAQPCGNGELDEGEECDDGNTIDTDACTAACTISICGDGSTWQGEEECDDGNTEDADGCTNECIELFPDVYMTEVDIGWEMWRYSPEDDTWETLTGPGTTFGNLAWDGTYLYSSSWSGQIYRYDPSLDSWAHELTAPQEPSTAYPHLFWTDDGIFYTLAQPFGDQSPIFVYRNDAWTEIIVDHNITQASSWDPVAHELYFRLPYAAGFFVFDTTTDSVTRTVLNETPVYEDSRTGTFLDGWVYAHPESGELVRLDPYDGSQHSTGVVPTSMLTAAAADHYKGHLYLAGAGPFLDLVERYDVNDGSLVQLAPVPTEPIGGGSWAGITNLVVAYPSP